MEHVFPELVPLFVGEARERLERLALHAHRLVGDAAALADARRELHTLKGAGRMMRLPGFAALCHAAEGLLGSPHAGTAALLLRAVDRLAAMVEAVGRGDDPGEDPPLVALLERGVEVPAKRPLEAPEPGRQAAEQPAYEPAPRPAREPAPLPVGAPAEAPPPQAALPTAPATTAAPAAATHGMRL